MSEYEIRGVWPDEVHRLEGLINHRVFKVNPQVRVIAAQEPERLTGISAWEMFDKAARLHLRVRRNWMDSIASRDLLTASIQRMRDTGVAYCFAPLPKDSPYEAMIEKEGFKIRSTSESWLVRIEDMQDRVTRIADALRRRSKAPKYVARNLKPEDWDQIKKLVAGRGLYPEQMLQSAQERESCSPDVSIVIAEGERIVGVTLTRIKEKVASVEARAVLMEADEHSQIINALMFERFVEKALQVELEFLVFSGDSVHHKETLNMARRFGGRLRNARNRWLLELTAE